jgi:hypothetical protein
VKTETVVNFAETASATFAGNSPQYNACYDLVASLIDDENFNRTPQQKSDYDI